MYNYIIKWPIKLHLAFLVTGNSIEQNILSYDLTLNIGFFLNDTHLLKTNQVKQIDEGASLSIPHKFKQLHYKEKIWILLD
jgi:hypothetical protein